MTIEIKVENKLRVNEKKKKKRQQFISEQQNERIKKNIVSKSSKIITHGGRNVTATEQMKNILKTINEKNNNIGMNY